LSDLVNRLSEALSGRYKIVRQIGEGGMATVYLAEDLKHHRQVALTVLKPELAAIVGAERFLAEMETTAALQHPNILPLHDSGEADGGRRRWSDRQPRAGRPGLRDRAPSCQPFLIKWRTLP